MSIEAIVRGIIREELRTFNDSVLQPALEEIKPKKRATRKKKEEPKEEPVIDQPPADEGIDDAEFEGDEQPSVHDLMKPATMTAAELLANVKARIDSIVSLIDDDEEAKAMDKQLKGQARSMAVALGGTKVTEVPEDKREEYWNDFQERTS